MRMIENACDLYHGRAARIIRVLREILQRLACGHKRVPVVLAVMLSIVLLASVSACSQRDTGESPGSPGGSSTISASSAAQVTIRTSSAPATIAGGTTKAGTTAAPARRVTLSIEGDRGVRFSGLCESGGKETVISGTVPKLFRYSLREQKISCRIQKQGGKGVLRVTLLSDNTTRSVQQTSARKGTIHVTYSGGG